MEQISKKFNKTTGALVVLGILFSFGVGFSVGKHQITCQVCKPEDIDFSLFWQSYKTLQEKFVSPEKIDKTTILNGAIAGMVRSLGDPYTVFLDKDDSKKFLEDVSGQFEGIGIEIGEKNGQLQVISPLEGTPAKAAGLRAGDKILKINSKFTTAMSIDEAVNAIRGSKGTKVTLTMFRDGWRDSKDISITRAVIEIPSLKLEFKELPNHQKVAYIRMYEFSENLSSEFAKAAQEILNSDAKSIVLDLRDNPGGYLEVSQDIAGWLLKKNQTVVIEDYGKNQPQNPYTSTGNAALADYPMVVLINKGSASASEILAGALRDDRNIQLIGEKSFGKGSIQELEKLPGGAVLKVTIAHWLTPKGTLIAEKGLEPDVKVELTDDDYAKNKDPQLDKALEIVNGIR